MNELRLDSDPDFDPERYDKPTRATERRDIKQDIILAALAAPPNSSSKLSRHIVYAQTRWKDSSDTTPRTNKISPVQNDDQKQQIVPAEHAVRNLSATNVTSTTLDGQSTRSTVVNTDENSILNYRKPPDSPKSSSSAVRSTETDERTTSANLRDNIIDSAPSDERLNKYTAENTNGIPFSTTSSLLIVQTPLLIPTD